MKAFDVDCDWGFEVDFLTNFKNAGNGIIQETTHRTVQQNSPTSDVAQESGVEEGI